MRKKRSIQFMREIDKVSTVISLSDPVAWSPEVGGFPWEAERR